MRVPDFSVVDKIVDLSIASYGAYAILEISNITYKKVFKNLNARRPFCINEIINIILSS